MRNTGRKLTNNGYVMIKRQVLLAHKRDWAFEHVLIAEKALGHELPAGARVHHVNGVKTDNRPENLVVCPGDAYHALLHQRADALDACEHADWVKCCYCKQYAPAGELKRHGRVGATWIYHAECKHAYYNKWKERHERKTINGKRTWVKREAAMAAA